MATFTIYDCGTAFDENSNDIIARLAKETSGRRGTDWMINAGPGSEQASQTDIGRRLGGKFDQITGLGMYPAALTSLAAVARVNPSEVNLVGWSRGAITCLMTARALPGIPCNLFLFDPVIGDPVLNRALHSVAPVDTIGVNVRQLTVIQQLDATDFIFQAHNPFSATTNQAGSTRLLTMPGSHGSSVYETSPEYAPASQIGASLVREFLRAHGTALGGPATMSNNEYVEAYSTLWLNISRGVAYVPSEGVISNRGEATGSQRNLTLRLFFNSHHIEVLNRYAPQMTLALLYTLISRKRPHPDLLAKAQGELARLSGGQPAALEYLRKASSWFGMFH